MSKPVPEGEIKAIERLREQYIATANAGDAAAWSATLTEDAVFLPPHEPPISGNEAVRSWITKSFFDPFKIQLTFSHEELEVAGDLAFVRGAWNYSLTPKAGGAVIKDSGKYLDILRRQPDGSWKYARVIWNSNEPLPGAGH